MGGRGMIDDQLLADAPIHTMRVSVPTLPTILSSSTTTARISTQEAVARIAAFLAPGNATVITGAGVSVDSGIRAYRGKDGRYMNPNYK